MFGVLCIKNETAQADACGLGALNKLNKSALAGFSIQAALN